MSGLEAYYKPEEKVFCSDGREDELVRFITSHKDFEEIKGNPEKVLATIDEFGRTRDFLMNVGKYKGPIVVQAILDKKPKVMAELGCYVGYSAILFADAVRKAGGSKYFSLERSAEFAQVARSLIKIAGLEDFVEVVVGPCRESLRNILAKQLCPDGLDMLFLDHTKADYANDLKLCEEIGLIRTGTLIIADNVISPGAPGYLEYVRSDTKAKQKAIESDSSASTERDLSQGNPKLIYKTSLIKSLEPTGEVDGLEITQCMGSEDWS